MSRSRQPGCLSGLLGLGALAVLAAVLFGAGDEQSQQPLPDTTATGPAKNHKSSGPAQQEAETPPFADVAQAARVVGTLPVKGRAPLTDYSREAFGTAWSDTNDNGCDTRNDILRRDLRRKVVDDCVVMSGVLEDPYSGQRVAFTRGPVSSLEVQIDHVVPLANAWQTGAAYWTDEKRERFANDRRNLLAVRGDLNMQKSDGDAATWLPPSKSFRCTYVSMQVLTKQRYDLWLTAPEKSAIERVLGRC